MAKPTNANMNANYEKLKAFLNVLDEVEVTVGLNADEGARLNDAGISIAQTAAYNEFGTRSIPARPAYRQTAADRSIIDAATRNLATSLFNAAYNDSLAPDVATNAMHRAGEEIGDGLARRVADFASPPNAPATIRKKGFNDPLVETGETLNSLSALTTRRGKRIKKSFVRPR